MATLVRTTMESLKASIVPYKRPYKGKLVKLVLSPQRELVSSDILLFSQSSTRGNNDASNKKREMVLEKLAQMEDTHAFLTDAEHGLMWSSMRDKLFSAVGSLGEGAFQLERKAGRGNTYDFLLKFANGTTKKIEFKGMGSSIADQPQFLSLPDTTNRVLGVSYAEFFYDTYLDQVLSCYPECVPKPSKEDYIRLVKNVNYDCHPMLKHLYAGEKNADKDALVDKSIHDYLVLYAKQVNFGLLQAKLKDTQTGKVFLMWNGTNFYTQTFSDEMFVLPNEYSLKTGRNKLFHTLVIGNFNLLLRWRNHKGVLNPCWQIKLMDRKG